MYVYHLDRAHSLKEGQILDLVPLKHKEIYDLKTLDFLNPLPNNPPVPIASNPCAG